MSRQILTLALYTQKKTKAQSKPTLTTTVGDALEVDDYSSGSEPEADSDIEFVRRSRSSKRSVVPVVSRDTSIDLGSISPTVDSGMSLDGDASTSSSTPSILDKGADSSSALPAFQETVSEASTSEGMSLTPDDVAADEIVEVLTTRIGNHFTRQGGIITDEQKQAAASLLCNTSTDIAFFSRLYDGSITPLEIAQRLASPASLRAHKRLLYISSIWLNRAETEKLEKLLASDGRGSYIRLHAEVEERLKDKTWTTTWFHYPGEVGHVGEHDIYGRHADARSKAGKVDLEKLGAVSIYHLAGALAGIMPNNSAAAYLSKNGELEWHNSHPGNRMPSKVDYDNLVFTRVPICTWEEATTVGCHLVIEDSLMALCGKSRLNTIPSPFFVRQLSQPGMVAQAATSLAGIAPEQMDGVILGDATGVHGTHSSFWSSASGTRTGSLLRSLLPAHLTGWLPPHHDIHRQQGFRSNIEDVEERDLAALRNKLKECNPTVILAHGKVPRKVLLRYSVTDPLPQRFDEQSFFVRSLMLEGRKRVLIATVHPGYFASHRIDNQDTSHSLPDYEDSLFLFLVCSALASQLNHDADAVLSAFSNTYSAVCERYKLANTRLLAPFRLAVYENLVKEGKTALEAYDLATADSKVFGRAKSVVIHTLTLNEDGKADPEQLVEIRGKRAVVFPIRTATERGTIRFDSFGAHSPGQTLLQPPNGVDHGQFYLDFSSFTIRCRDVNGLDIPSGLDAAKPFEIRARDWAMSPGMMNRPDIGKPTFLETLARSECQQRSLGTTILDAALNNRYKPYLSGFAIHIGMRQLLCSCVLLMVI